MGASILQNDLLTTGNEAPVGGSCEQSVLQVLLRGGLFPAEVPLGSLVALGCRGILWLEPSRLLRSASAEPPPRAVLLLFLPEQTEHKY